MTVEIISYYVGVGASRDVATRQICASYEDAIRQAGGAKFRGEIWAAPVTNYGAGRWKQIGWYDGRGGVFAGPDGDEPATREVFELLTTTFN